MFVSPGTYVRFLASIFRIVVVTSTKLKNQLNLEIARINGSNYYP